MKLFPSMSAGGAEPPPDMPKSALANFRSCVPAPMLMTQGLFAGEPTVSGRGPLLPAEVATNTPASRAPRNASESSSFHGSLGPPPIE